MNKCILQPHQI
uniref:Uncharacterized protein n=1 Tax=Amphimedon queenslandica TaxID=400682 RepID=A0A1X7UKZ9_AMPQE